MATMTSALLSPEQKSTLADLLGEWAILPETERYQAEQRCTLRYTGSEPLCAGAKLYLDTGHYGHIGMLHCTGMTSYWDESEHHHLSNFLSRPIRDKLHTSINITLSKSLEHIAKDVQKRLIAPYLEAYQLAMWTLHKAKNAHAQHYERALTLARKLPQGKVRNGERLQDQYTVESNTGPSWIISSDTYAVSGFRMSVAQAHLLADLFTSAAWQQAKTL
jgi:hypothetical protein